MVKNIPSFEITEKSESLRNALNSIEGWSDSGFSPLDQQIIDVLLVDDYVNMNFSDKDDIISLYVGYYLSNKKVGAAHDPLVCFPGQGWRLTNKVTEKLESNLPLNDSISYSMMVGTLGQQKILIIYWFQAYDTSNSNTFSQKISLFYNRILHKGEDNAFVRVTIPIKNRPIQEVKSVLDKFIISFYPVFLEHIIEDQI